MQKKLIPFIILLCLLLALVSCRTIKKEQDEFAPTILSTPLPFIESEEIEYPLASLYVSPHGNNDNNGESREEAFATIGYALELAEEGDVISILEGIYTEGIEVEELNKITIIGEGDAILDGQRKIRMGIWCEYCEDITFANLTFRNYTDVGIGVYLSDQILMQNLVVHNNGFAVQLKEWEFEGYGIMVDESSNVSITHNVVYENGPNPQISPDFLMGTGINIYACTHCQMNYNQVYKNIGGTLVEDSVDILVEGNEVWGNDLDASIDEWWDGGVWVDGGHDITIRNNIFRDNLGPGIQISNENNQDVYGYLLENNTSTGNYFGVYLWNFGTNDFPDENILRLIGNTISKNSQKDILITDWECPPDDPCD